MDNWTGYYCEKENNFFFFLNYVAFLFTFFDKVSAICEFRFQYISSKAIYVVLY